MNVAKLLQNPRFTWNLRGAPDTEALEAFREQAPDNLPRTYMKLMRAGNGASGKVPYESGHIEVWPLESVVVENQSHGVTAALPGFFAFATDGGESLFAFDLREPDGAAVVSLNAKSLDTHHVEFLAASFSEFLEHAVNMGRNF